MQEIQASLAALKLGAPQVFRNLALYPCERFGVRRLELFGSAASGAFDAARSDFDFLAEFGSAAGMKPLEQYFGLKDALEAVLGRSVDLVEAGASSNPHFLESVNKSRRLLHAA